MLAVPYHEVYAATRASDRMSNPEDEPLGGKPILPVPSPDAQRRAHPLFSRILAERQGERSQEGQAEWQPTPHDDPTRVTNRETVMVELARRKRQRELHAEQVSRPPADAQVEASPEPMSAIATDPFSKLPDAFPTAPSEMLHDEPTHSKRAFPVMHFASGRRYDATLALIQAMAGPLEKTDPDDDGYRDTPAQPQMAVDTTSIDDAELNRLAALSDETPAIARDAPRGPPPPPDEEDEPTRITSRPPPFAPMVRPSAPAPKGAELVDQDTLTAMVDTSMLVAQPDGTAAFEIAFDDEVFQNLACTIAVGPGGVIATFRAPDVNTRRLLEAEAGRLRVRLSERGLKVAEVRVEGG